MNNSYKVNFLEYSYDVVEVIYKLSFGSGEYRNCAHISSLQESLATLAIANDIDVSKLKFYIVQEFTSYHKESQPCFIIKFQRPARGCDSQSEKAQCQINWWKNVLKGIA